MRSTQPNLEIGIRTTSISSILVPPVAVSRRRRTQADVHRNISRLFLSLYRVRAVSKVLELRDDLVTQLGVKELLGKHSNATDGDSWHKKSHRSNNF